MYYCTHTPTSTVYTSATSWLAGHQTTSADPEDPALLSPDNDMHELMDEP